MDYVCQTVPQNLQDLRQRTTREVIALRSVHLASPDFDAMRGRDSWHSMELRLKAEQGRSKDSKYLT